MDNDTKKIVYAFYTIQELEKVCYNAQEFGEKVKMLLRNIDKQNEKKIGVIACTITDFNVWKEEQNFDMLDTYNMTSNRFKNDNTTYYCITREEHLRGHRFNEMMETPRAKENKQYDRIVESSKYCLLK